MPVPPLFIQLFLALCFLTLDTDKIPMSERFVGGIQVHETDLAQWVKSVDEAGLNTVEVTVYAKQGIWNSDQLWFENEEPWVVEEIRLAKKQGLKVVLILRVALQHRFPENKFLWHGMIMPKNNALLQSWFHTYQHFVLKWSRIAQENGVDVVVIGSELNALTATTVIDKLPELEAFYTSKKRLNQYESRVLQYESSISSDDLWEGAMQYNDIQSFIRNKCEALHAWGKKTTFHGSPLQISLINERRQKLGAHWTSVIESARSVYAGQLSFAANFDNYHEVAFWDQLDIVGINAYFPLTEHGHSNIPRLEVMKRAWRSTFRTIKSNLDRIGISEMPVLFTELGYINRENCTLRPWKPMDIVLLINQIRIYSLFGQNKKGASKNAVLPLRLCLRFARKMFYHLQAFSIGNSPLIPITKKLNLLPCVFTVNMRIPRFLF